MVNLAKQNAPEAEILQIDGENLPFADKEFDLVTTTTVLQHNPDARRTKLLGEICRVSAMDVLLFEDTAVEMPPFTAGMGPYQNFYARPIGWYAGVCSSHGFEPIEFDRQETSSAGLCTCGSGVALIGVLGRRERSFQNCILQ